MSTFTNGSTSGPVHLTPRQLDVLRLMAEGLSNKQIAARLKIAPGTVATHKLMMADRLGARNSAQMVVMAVRQGLI